MKITEKLNNAFLLLFNIAVDLLVVIILSAYLECTEYLLENSKNDGILLYIIYLSNAVSIIVFSLYVLSDLYKHLVETYKKIKKI